MGLANEHAPIGDVAAESVARLWRTHLRYASSLPAEQAVELGERMSADPVFASDLLALAQLACDALTSCAVDDDTAFVARSERFVGDERLQDPLVAAMARFILDDCAEAEFERLGCDGERRAAAFARAEALTAKLDRRRPASPGPSIG